MKIFRKLLLLAAALLCPALTAAPDAARLNRLFGIEIFDAAGKWDTAGFLSRTKLRFTGGSGRFAARLNRQIAGAQATEMILFTDREGKNAERISITFSNKGDTAERSSSRIRNDGRTLLDRLTRELGRSRRDREMIGSVSTRAEIWDLPSAKVCLEMEKKEFVMLHIIPVTANVPAEKTARPAKDLSGNVRRNDFGDVFIPNVPMVDQGAKGYCVPATMERIFLYYGIRCDMHHLAESGKSDRKSGTNVNVMLRDIAGFRRKAGLKFQQFGELSVREISRHIDRGNPVMWLMFSTGELNEVYRFSAANRGKSASPDEWRRRLKRVSVHGGSDGAHACLIIGYNRITDEIAVSNSWGPHWAVRWIPVKVARKLSQGALMVFFP